MLRLALQPGCCWGKQGHFPSPVPTLSDSSPWSICWIKEGVERRKTVKRRGVGLHPAHPGLHPAHPDSTFSMAISMTTPFSRLRFWPTVSSALLSKFPRSGSPHSRCLSPALVVWMSSKSATSENDFPQNFRIKATEIEMRSLLMLGWHMKEVPHYSHHTAICSLMFFGMSAPKFTTWEK